MTRWSGAQAISAAEAVVMDDGERDIDDLAQVTLSLNFLPTLAVAGKKETNVSIQSVQTASHKNVTKDMENKGKLASYID